VTRVAAVILAAGASTRLGEPKQLAMLGGERLLERAVRVAVEAGCAPVVVVLGAQAERILAECDFEAAQIVINEAWSEGMASSIRAGIAAIAGVCDAAVVMTCDQPAVTPDHLRKLAAACAGSSAASAYAGRKGVPACFAAGHFPELNGLKGETGARSLLESAQAVDLELGELDIDTVESLEAARTVFP
jgi:molybdenum cofactor cytidylyltransferase